MIDWFVETLRAYPQLAVFLALGIGFVVGPMKVAGFNLGNVTFFMALMNGWAYASPIDNR
jgi:hypothetical protein